MNLQKLLMQAAGQQLAGKLVRDIANAGISPQMAVIGLTIAAAGMVATLIETDEAQLSEPQKAERVDEFLAAFREALSGARTKVKQVKAEYANDLDGSRLDETARELGLHFGENVTKH